MTNEARKQLISEVEMGLNDIEHVAISEEEYTKSINNIIKILNTLSDEEKSTNEIRNSAERITLDEHKFNEELKIKKAELDYKVASLNFEQQKHRDEQYAQIEERKVKKLEVILGAAAKGLSILLPAGVAVFGMTTAMKAEYLDSQRTPSTFKDFWKMMTGKL